MTEYLSDEDILNILDKNHDFIKYSKQVLQKYDKVNWFFSTSYKRKGLINYIIVSTKGDLLFQACYDDDIFDEHILVSKCIDRRKEYDNVLLSTENCINLITANYKKYSIKDIIEIIDKRIDEIYENNNK